MTLCDRAHYASLLLLAAALPLGPVACVDDPPSTSGTSTSSGAGAAGGGGAASTTSGGGQDASDGGGGGGMAPGCASAAMGRQEDHDCTMVIGFSQTSNWYGNEVNDWFEGDPAIDGSRWQLLWHGGAGVERWADPAYEGWDVNAPATSLVSPCANDFGGVDRVVLTISSNVLDHESTPTEWADLIQQAVDTVASKVPMAGTIVLQPVVGTSDPTCDTVRAARNHPAIVAGIELAADENAAPARVVGFIPTVATCGDFLDTKGHLSPEVGALVGAEIAQCYGGGQ